MSRKSAWSTSQGAARTSAANVGRIDPSARRPLSAASLQSWVLAVVVGWTIIEPYYAVRVGGLVAAILFITRIRKYRTGRTDVWLMIFLALALATNLWTSFPERAWATTISHICITALVLCVRAVCTTRADYKVVSLGLLVGCAYTLFQLWRIRAWVGAGNLAAVSEFTPDVNDYTVEILGANKNYLAYGLAMGIVVVLLLWSGSVKRRLLPLAVPLILLTGGIYFIGARGALLSIVLIAVWVALHRLLPRTSLHVLGFSLATVTLILASGVLDEEVTPQQVAGRETGTLNSRLLIWPLARSLIIERPWGWGPGAFTEMNLLGIVAHNAILEIGVGMGVLGIVVYLCLLHSLLFHDTANVPVRQRTLSVGATMCALAPILSSGHWEQAGPGWVLLGLISMLPVWCAPATLERHEDGTQSEGPNVRGRSEVSIAGSTRPTVIEQRSVFPEELAL